MTISNSGAKSGSTPVTSLWWWQSWGPVGDELTWEQAVDLLDVLEAKLRVRFGG
jgi:hypothetical protein